MSTNIPNSQNSTWGMGFDLRQGEHDYTNVSLILNPGISPPKVGTTLNRCPRVSYEPYYGKNWWVGAILIHFKLKDWSPWLYWGNFTLSLHKIKPFGSQFPHFGKTGKKNLINTKNACTWSFQTGNADKEHLIQEIKLKKTILLSYNPCQSVTTKTTSSEMLFHRHNSLKSTKQV